MSASNIHRLKACFFPTILRDIGFGFTMLLVDNPMPFQKKTTTGSSKGAKWISLRTTPSVDGHQGIGEDGFAAFRNPGGVSLGPSLMPLRKCVPPSQPKQNRCHPLSAQMDNAFSVRRRPMPSARFFCSQHIMPSNADRLQGTAEIHQIPECDQPHLSTLFDRNNALWPWWPQETRTKLIRASMEAIVRVVSCVIMVTGVAEGFRSPISCYHCASQEYRPHFGQIEHLNDAYGAVTNFGNFCDTNQGVHNVAPARTCDYTCVTIFEPQFIGGILNQVKPFAFTRGCITDVFPFDAHRPAEVDFLHRSDICLSLPLSQIWPSAQLNGVVHVCSCSSNGCNMHDALAGASSSSFSVLVLVFGLILFLHRIRKTNSVLL
uniref:Protein quiver n=1 Tax=Panagrellus redivivus TaxID=6233 RepID=A0A7E5A0P5_PANRE